MRSGRPDGIGAPLRRLEDPRLVTGGGRYVDDIALDGTLHVAFVRSPEPHATVEDVDISEALIPGVVGIYTAADLGLERPMPNPHPHPSVEGSVQQRALAEAEVCYVGEPVAVVVAEDRYTAADAADLVWIEYEPLPASGRVEVAAAPDAAPVHLGSESNLITTLRASFGDVDDAFSRADVVVPLSLHQHRGACASMEPRGVLARRDGDKITVWSSTQGPYPLQRMLSAYFGLDDLRVVAPDVGGGFGPKGGIYAEEYVLTALAMRLDRPVKWIETRREHFLTTNQQRDLVADLEVAATSDGRLLGLRGRLLHDNGAYVPYGIVLPMTGFQLIQGPYTLEAMDLELDVVYTNAVPTSPIRGAARPNAAFIAERAIDAVASTLGIDRAEIRRRNFIPRDAFPYEFPLAARFGGNITYDSGDYERALDEVLRLADYEGFEHRRKAAADEGRRLGIGIAAYVEDTGLGPHERVRVAVDDDGVVHVTVGANSQGQGHATVYAQLCATELGVDPSSVVVHAGDSDLPGNGVATVASRTAVTAGSSTHLAASDLASRLRDHAARHLEAAAEDIVLEDGSARVAGVPGTAVSFADLAGMMRAAGEDPWEDGEHPAARPPYAFGCHVAEVEVDAETGLVTVVRYSVAHDCGTILNPVIVDGQIDGGVAHGLSNALLERVVYTEDGQPRTTTFMDFRIPTAMEMPPLEKVHTVTPAPDNPIGVKGAGEGGTIPAAAAVASAVEDAVSDLGVQVDRQPLTPDVVYGMITGTGRD